MSEQLALRVSLCDESTFENYYVGENAALIATLKDLSSPSAEQFIYLYGSGGTGRSHLLQAVCHDFLHTGRGAFYLSFKDQLDLDPAILEELEQLDLVCLDDVDTLFGRREWEEALFHFYNRMQTAKTCLIVSAKTLPNHSNMQLNDLKSRLNWGLTWQLKPLNDTQKLATLQLRAERRGLQLSDDVGKFLLHRYPRDMQALFLLLEKLDQASLAAQRKLTIPFVKTVLMG